MEYDDYIQRAISRLKKQSEVQQDSAEGWASLAIAEELHRLNEHMRTAEELKRIELEVMKRMI